jgi:cellulose synthase/poly-beta-1,6-N-acetylglucosamine synthase-like glycosyltransferase
VAIEQLFVSFVNMILRMISLLLSDPVSLLVISFFFLNTLGYLFILTVVAWTKRSSNSGKEEILKSVNPKLPLISFIIPAHNEEEVIERKLENTFELNHSPNAVEVIAVDDGSTDQTRSILQNLKETRFPKLRVISQDRKGKSAAENAGLQASTSEIIVISDADVPLNADALRFVVEDFRDPQVGGVTCSLQAGQRYVLAMNLDLALYARKLENKIDSVFGMSGPCVAFRKSIISRIDEGIYSSDTDLGVRVRRNGFKVVFNQNIVSDIDRWVISRPRTITDSLKKMKHLSFGSLDLFRRHNGALFRRSLGFFGLIIAPRHLLLNIFAPVVFMLFFANFMLKLVENGLFPAFGLLVSLFLLITLISRILVPRLSFTKVLYLILMYVLGYFAQFIYYIDYLCFPHQRQGTWKGV